MAEEVAEEEAPAAAGARRRRPATRSRPPIPPRRDPARSPDRRIAAPAQVPFVALTGGIGAGKSTALAALRAPRRRGALHRRGRARALRERRGPARRDRAVGPGGRTRRASSTARRSPRGRSRRRRTGAGSRSCSGRSSARGWRRGGRRRRRPPTRRRRALVVEVPLLFESGMEAAFDATIAVSPTTRSAGRRAGARGHAALDERTARQLTQAEKAGRATYVVVNDGSVEELERQLSAVLDKLRVVTTRARTAPRRASAPPAHDPVPHHARARRPPGARVAARRWPSSAVGRRRDLPAAAPRGEGDHAPAAPRGHHPPAGPGQGARSRPHRRGDLRGVQVPRPDVARRARRASCRSRRPPRSTSPTGPGGTAFELKDLSTPQVNISYGSFYLRYLLDRYGGNEMLALAAYNAGEGNVDRVARRRRAQRGAVRASRDIPFPETRAYVERVQDAQRDYRREYARELGL